jgi:quercetin dioxygenase-like cupin family protein
VIEAYGRWFLATVNSSPLQASPGGRRVTTIGPMARPPGRRLVARFMQAMTRPGAATQPHSHDGPEAFHVLSGAICMESPMGAATTGTGGDYWIGGGHPMQLTSVGKDVRRSLFVVVHPAGRPWMNVNIPWKPKGLCRP